MATIIIGALVFLSLAWAVRSLVKNKSGCAGGCSGCPSAQGCTAPEKEEH